jgi:molybdopterin molybdotransferase
MQSVDSYLNEIIAAITALPLTDVPLTDADGTVLAADTTAEWPLPSFDNSAMDGYAVIAADVASASADQPVTLPVDAEVAAGDTTAHTLTPGHSIKIMTGALLPDGADAVIPVEWTDDGRQTVVITQPASPGHAIRRAGDDAKPGDLLLPAGTRLGPAQIGVLAAAGHGVLRVRRRPRVTVISTGNELAEPGSPLVPGRIWDSNSYMLASAARQAGCETTRYPTQRDEPDAVLAAIEHAAATSDLLVTSGGVSMGGEHDVVKAALTRLGTVSFRKVAMQPGMPQGFGTLGPDHTPLFTLPGNPVSAYVSFLLFAAPALRKLQDLPAQRPRLLTAALADAVRSPAGRRSYLRGVLDDAEQTVVPLTGQSSHQLGALAQANALIVVPEQITRLEAGTGVDVMCLP